ncbi:MAG: hypothetical protein WD963_00865 [Candidatus Paceibacterota bacterium]
MKILTKIIKNMSLMVVFTLLPFSSTLANEINNPLNTDYSMYKYHALENKTAIFDLVNNMNNLEEPPEVQSQSGYDAEKEWQQIAKKQNFSLEQITNAMETLKSRNEIRTFLIGNNLSILKFQLVQIKEQMIALNALAQKTKNNVLKTQISDEIEFLQEEQVRVENFIIEQENKFKLFGWFVAML